MRSTRGGPGGLVPVRDGHPANVEGSLGMASPDRPSVAFTALGAAVGVADGMVRVTGFAFRGARRAAGPVVNVTRGVAPPLLWRAGERVVADLDRRGRAEAVAALAETSVFLEALADRIAENPALLRLVNDIVGHVLEPAIDTALPVVLDKLVQDPEPVRQLVGAQSLGMADELADRARVSAAHGDDAFERLATRLRLRRKVKATAEGAPAAAEPQAAPEVVPSATPAVVAAGEVIVES
jgi:hypothetical protein